MSNPSIGALSTWLAQPKKEDSDEFWESVWNEYNTQQLRFRARMFQPLTQEEFDSLWEEVAHNIMEV